MCEYSYGRGAPNKVFRVKSKGMTDSTPEIKKLPIGDALETEGHGTGGAVADLNGDGVLDLLLSHGESTASQALELYQVTRIHHFKHEKLELHTKMYSFCDLA